VQSPLSIGDEELSQRLIWGAELKAIVQQRFVFGSSIGALAEELPYNTNQVSLDAALRDDLGDPVP
jgi:hypothetical protein